MRMEKKNQPVYNYNNAACSMALSKAEHDLIDDILLGAEEKSSSSESFFSIDDHAFVDSVLLPPTTQSPVISDSLDDVDNELHKMDSPLEQAAPDRTSFFSTKRVYSKTLVPHEAPPKLNKPRSCHDDLYKQFCCKEYVWSLAWEERSKVYDNGRDKVCSCGKCQKRVPDIISDIEGELLRNYQNISEPVNNEQRKMNFREDWMRAGCPEPKDNLANSEWCIGEQKGFCFNFYLRATGHLKAWAYNKISEFKSESTASTFDGEKRSIYTRSADKKMKFLVWLEEFAHEVTPTSKMYKEFRSVLKKPKVF